MLTMSEMMKIFGGIMIIGGLGGIILSILFQSDNKQYMKKYILTGIFLILSGILIMFFPKIV